jgi:hypothetical protein
MHDRGEQGYRKFLGYGVCKRKIQGERLLSRHPKNQMVYGGNMSVALKDQLAAWFKLSQDGGQIEMSTDISHSFLTCMMNENMNRSNADVDAQIEQDPLYQLISKRAAFMGLEISFWSKIFFILMTQKPGAIVVYLSVLRYKHGKSPVTLTEVTHMFPFGFYSDSKMEELWNAQKGYTMGLPFDNMLDKINWEEIDG